MYTSLTKLFQSAFSSRRVILVFPLATIIIFRTIKEKQFTKVVSDSFSKNCSIKYPLRLIPSYNKVNRFFVKTRFVLIKIIETVGNSFGIILNVGNNERTNKQISSRITTPISISKKFVENGIKLPIIAIIAKHNRNLFKLIFSNFKNLLNNLLLIEKRICRKIYNPGYFIAIFYWI